MKPMGNSEVKRTEGVIKFGTDGWRGIIAQDFTFDKLRHCAQGVADFMKNAELANKGLLIGYDTRFASEDFAQAAAEVIAGNNIKTYLCLAATPTPVISYGVIARKAGGAIVITASHNPNIWNGFKFKTADGASAPEEVAAELEKLISRSFTIGDIKSIPVEKAESQGLLEYYDIVPDYFTQINRLININELRSAEMKIIIDPMFGAGMGYLKRLLEGGNIKVVEVNNERNPVFPGMKQPEPITQNLGRLITTVKRHHATVGIATDGDADRVGIVDEKGNFITTLQTFALLCLYLLKVRGERGVIVKTVTSTSMIYRLGEIFNVPVVETRVGFKYVAPIMISENALIGGEESGGYGFRGHVPERDGILAGLYFLDLIRRMGKTPSEIITELYSMVGPHYFNRIDLKFPEVKRQEIMRHIRDNRPREILGIKVIKVDTFDGFRFRLADNSWLLIRFSGTEPLLRTYAEAESMERVGKLLQQAKEMAGLR